MDTLPVPSIYALPNELLEAICAAGHQGRGPHLPHFKPEWSLSHVSRCFPVLNAEGSVEISKLYLERAQACEIWAFLEVLEDSDVDRELVLAERFSIFLPHIHRMWRFQIQLDKFRPLIFDPLRNLSAPNLLHLEVINLQSNAASRNPIELFFAGAPKLGAFTMKNLDILPPAPPWTASLAHLNLWGGQDGNMYDVTQLIAQCPLLTELALDMRRLVTREDRLHIPSLKSLQITIFAQEMEGYLLFILDLFNTPALLNMTVDGSHGDQILELFNSRSLPNAIFPALVSLSFISTSCQCEKNLPKWETPVVPPIQLFPSLSSLTLVNQCYTTNLIRGLFSPSSQPWPSLKYISVSCGQETLEAVSNALRIAVHRRGSRVLPKFRISPALWSFEDWRRMDADIEMGGPDNSVLSTFH
ncbi:F-box domain-containing protein, partial [Favolaschia claudopus]